MKKKTIIITVAILVLAALGVFGIVSAITATTQNPTGSTNPDDATNYITQTTDANGVVKLTFTATKGAEAVSVGTVRTDTTHKYEYRYGQYYNGSSWVNQTENIGWGCRVTSTSETSYADPAGYVDELPVTHFNYCYSGCTKIKSIPNVPYIAKNTTRIFNGCTSLKAVEIRSLNRLDSYAFAGCSNLQMIYAGKNLETCAANAFNGVNASCVLSYEGTAIPSGWNATGRPTVSLDADILIWRVDAGKLS